MSMNKQTHIPPVTNGYCAVKAEVPSKVKVVVRIPDHIPESVQRQKINQIYDILKPKAVR